MLVGLNNQSQTDQIAAFYSISLDAAKVMAFDLMRKKLGIDPKESEFNRMIQAVKATDNIKDSGFREWQLQNIARRFKRSRKELMEAYNKALIHQAPIKPLTLAELKKLNEGKNTSYLVQGWIAQGVTLLLHGFGGSAKTLMMYELGAAISTGKPWNGYKTTKGDVLVLQADEPTHITEDRLDTLGITSDDDSFTVFPNWQVEQIAQLESLLSERKDQGRPVRCVIVDSVTSINKNTLISENDVEYARPMLQLAAMAEQWGCTICVIHHSNANGDARGTKALHNVSEVWALSINNEQTGERMLRVQKNRLGRPPGRYKFDFDPKNNSFTYTGQEGEDYSAAETNQKQIELWLQEDEHRAPAA